MTGVLRVAVVTAVAGAMLAVSAPLSDAGRALAPCTGSMLAGSFKAVPGSAGAGNIVYRLTLTTRNGTSCFLSGVPALTLLDKAGRKLPTKAVFGGKPGTLTAVMVPIGPGKSASLTARFSPDVPGTDEPVLKRCEPTSYKLRIAPSGGGSVAVAISPPTPVCEHGGMQLSVFTVS